MRFLLLALLLALPLFPARATDPAITRVRLETSAGDIVLALDAQRAPRSVRSFMTYVDDGRLDGTEFYRASRSKRAPGQGFIQGGIGTNPRRKLPATPFEPTSETGLSHIDGAISMAHGDDPAVATCNFSLLVGPHTWLDARPASPGYAVFGRIESGQAVVKRILALPTGGGTGAMRGQMILKPVIIQRAVRLNGKPHPSGLPKTWLIDLPQWPKKR